jgi:hypothetical protein
MYDVDIDIIRIQGLFEIICSWNDLKDVVEGRTLKKMGLGSDMVVHAQNPSFLGGRGRRITVQDHPRKK